MQVTRDRLHSCRAASFLVDLRDGRCVSPENRRRGESGLLSPCAPFPRARAPVTYPYFVVAEALFEYAET